MKTRTPGLESRSFVTCKEREAGAFPMLRTYPCIGVEARLARGSYTVRGSGAYEWFLIRGVDAAPGTDMSGCGSDNNCESPDRQLHLPWRFCLAVGTCRNRAPDCVKITPRCTRGLDGHPHARSSRTSRSTDSLHPTRQRRGVGVVNTPSSSREGSDEPIFRRK